MTPEPFRADIEDAKARKAAKTKRIALIAAAALAVAVLAGALAFHAAFLRDMPALPGDEQLIAFGRKPAVRFTDEAGRVLAVRGPNVGPRVQADALPSHVTRAFLAAEDHRFYKHGALDLYGMTRAMAANLKAGRTVQGGSTISQQLAKGLFPRPARTLKRKIQEAALARRLERRLGKDGVLRLYMDRVYFGADAYGIEGAARTYFDKPAAKLTIAESALLAGLVNAPSRLDPGQENGPAWARARRVLAVMRRQGWINAQDEQVALAMPPRLKAPAEPPGEGDMVWALDYALGEARRLGAPGDIDLTIAVTAAPALQQTAADGLRATLQRSPWLGAEQGAVVMLGSGGQVRALVGGARPTAKGFNRAVDARRPAGSAFKPFIYAAALEDGVRRDSIRTDEPVEIDGWRPQNLDHRYRGEVTVEQALVHSLNTVAVQLAHDVGEAKIGDLSRRFGMTSIPEKPDFSVALGSYGVSLIELAGGYQVFARQGGYQRPWIVARVTGADGKALFTHQPRPAVQVYDRALAGEMTAMLAHVLRGGTAYRARLDRPGGGKTGTSQDYRDALMAGFTPDYTTVVWLGRDSNKPMNGLTGGDLPALLWKDLMVAAHRGLAPRDFN